MPERWEDEIRKLRELRPREDLNARVAEGPRGEPSPPTRQRVVAAVTALAVFAAAGFLVVRSFGTGTGTGTDRPDPAQTSDAAVAPPSLVLELRSGSGLGDEAPGGTLRYGDLKQEGVVETYSWCVGEECTSMIADFVFYPPAGEYHVVPPGTPIEVTGDGVVESLRFTDPAGDGVDDGTSRSAPLADGQYQVGVDASWDAGTENGSATIWFGVQVLSSPAAAPDVLHVDCGYGVTRADSAVVRTQADGLHLVFRGTDGFNGYQIVTPEGTPPEEFGSVGGGFGPGDGGVSPIRPGRWEIGCASGDRVVEAGDSTVAFELIDPDDHYAPIVACENPASQEFVSDIALSVPLQDAAVQLLSGLAPDDRVRAAGYGGSSLSAGPTFVVDRGGEAVASLALGEEAGAWSGTFVACPESGITLSDASGP